MKPGRADCRPIEGEEIPTYTDFLVKKYLEQTLSLFIQLQIVTSWSLGVPTVDR